MNNVPRMSNLYALLGLSPQADSQDIALAIAALRQNGELKTMILDKAEEWLLKPDVRARYDQQLRQHYPELFESAQTQTLSLELAEEPTEVRLGILDSEQHSRSEVRIEPQTPLESIVYVREQQRYHHTSRFIWIGLISALVLGIVWLFAWPLLKKTVFAPSEWDKHEFRQQMVQKGWKANNDADPAYVYLPSNEYTSQLMLFYKDNELFPALNTTTCDMNSKGLCDIKVRIDDGLLTHEESVGVGLQDYIPLASRGKREQMVEHLQQAQKIEVIYYSRGQQVKQTFGLP